MAITQADIDELEAAISTGVAEVQRGDERIKYRSLAEMRSVLARMKADFSGSSRSPGVRQITPRSVRGF